MAKLVKENLNEGYDFDKLKRILRSNVNREAAKTERELYKEIKEQIPDFDEESLDRAVREAKSDIKHAIDDFKDFWDGCQENPHYAIDNTMECITAYANSGDPLAYMPNPRISKI